MKDRKGEAFALGNLGGVYFNTGKLKPALDNLNQALTLARANSDHLGEANALNNLGEVYITQGDAQKALDAFNVLR